MKTIFKMLAAGAVFSSVSLSHAEAGQSVIAGACSAEKRAKHPDICRALDGLGNEWCSKTNAEKKTEATQDNGITGDPTSFQEKIINETIRKRDVEFVCGQSL